MKSADYDKKTIEKVQATVKSYFKNNYEDIETVEINKVFLGEMGGMEVSGTVNKNSTFNLSFNESDYTVGSLGLGSGFPQVKEKCKEKDCDY